MSSLIPGGQIYTDSNQTDTSHTGNNIAIKSNTVVGNYSQHTCILCAVDSVKGVLNIHYILKLLINSYGFTTIFTKVSHISFTTSAIISKMQRKKKTDTNFSIIQLAWVDVFQQ